MDKILLFMLGAGVGSLVTWKIVEQKYKKIADTEIESVIEQFKKREELRKENNKYPWGSKEYVENLTDEEKEDYKEVIDEYENIINEQGYKSESDEDCVIDVKPGREEIEPYVITPLEYGEFGNDEKSWTLHSDGIITDEVGEIISDPELIIGNALEHIGEHEEDSVHVRNENLEWDIEIIKINKSFAELNNYDEVLSDIAKGE